ncbi:unannotated protein [freshwater metagenome]|uniref:Unannotated protein n=1 Tax=freshwater metagenome TaxID=449393 RepID=A0A6J5YEP6_9ZZZZ
MSAGHLAGSAGTRPTTRVHPLGDHARRNEHSVGETRGRAVADVMSDLEYLGGAPLEG